jgi:hypothetical protein
MSVIALLLSVLLIQGDSSKEQSRQLIRQAIESLFSKNDPQTALSRFRESLRVHQSDDWHDYILGAGIASAAREHDSARNFIEAAMKHGFAFDDVLIAEKQITQETRQQGWWEPLVKSIRDDRLKKEAEQLGSKFQLDQNSALDVLETWGNDTSLSSEVLYQRLQNWNQYPTVSETGRVFLFFHESARFGSIPVRVYVPKAYDPNRKWPAIVQLHGATSQFVGSMAHFDISDGEPFLRQLYEHNSHIVITPIANRLTRFGWASNGESFHEIEKMVIQMKKRFNLDDDRIAMLGHSDGGRGAFAMLCKSPSNFSCMAGYNLGVGLIGDHVCFANVINRPLFIVQTDLDMINPPQDVENALKLLAPRGVRSEYRLSKGYNHFDKHLAMDFPRAYEYIQQQKRDTFPKQIHWECANDGESTCDWLTVRRLSLEEPKQEWHETLNFKIWDKRNQKETEFDMFDSVPTASVRATYADKVFHLEASRTSEVELTISPAMVDFSKPVVVHVNGRKVFEQNVSMSKEFLLKSFRQNHDRRRVWGTSILVSVDSDQ